MVGDSAASLHVWLMNAASLRVWHISAANLHVWHIMATIHARVILGVAVTAFKKEIYLYDIKMPSFNSRITPNEEVGTIRARGDAPKGSESFFANLMVGITTNE